MIDQILTYLAIQLTFYVGSIVKDLILILVNLLAFFANNSIQSVWTELKEGKNLSVNYADDFA